VRLGVLGRVVNSGLVTLTAVSAICWSATAPAIATRTSPAAAVPSASSPATHPAVTLAAYPRHVRSGHPVQLNGRVIDPLARRLVYLYASPYPYPVASIVATAVARADGSFSFRVQPDRNTRYRVILAGTPARALVQVSVADAVQIKLDALPLARAKVTIVARHPRDLHWGGALVRWSFALGSRGRFFAEPATRTRESRPGLTVLSTSVALPTGGFRFRACFEASGAGALLDPGRPPDCAGRGYSGNGTVPAGFPSPRAVAVAASYLAGRAGRTAFAVVDSQGRLSGVHVHWTFPTASVVKAMLLVAYLRRIDAQGQHYVDGYSNSILYPMIHVSDNNAATTVWSIVGDASLYRLARRAGMTDFSVVGSWGSALLSAADQARYFFEMDSLIPREFRGYARRLLSTIAANQSWAIPAVARPHHYAVFFKNGVEPTALGELVHQVARLERPDHSFAMAVMTDGDPSMGYGIDTIQGVANALVNAP
jgi:hypothetical protein